MSFGYLVVSQWLHVKGLVARMTPLGGGGTLRCEASQELLRSWRTRSGSRFSDLPQYIPPPLSYFYSKCLRSVIHSCQCVLVHPKQRDLLMMGWSLQNFPAKGALLSFVICLSGFAIVTES